MFEIRSRTKAKDVQKAAGLNWPDWQRFLVRLDSTDVTEVVANFVEADSREGESLRLREPRWVDNMVCGRPSGGKGNTE